MPIRYRYQYPTDPLLAFRLNTKPPRKIHDWPKCALHRLVELLKTIELQGGAKYISGTDILCVSCLERLGRIFSNFLQKKKKSDIPWNETVRGSFEDTHNVVSNPGRCAAGIVYILLFKTTAK